MCSQRRDCLSCHHGKTKFVLGPSQRRLAPDDQYDLGRSFFCEEQQGWLPRPCVHYQKARETELAAAVTECLRNSSEGGYPESLDTSRTDDVARELMDYTSLPDEFLGVTEEELRPLVLGAQVQLASTIGA